MTPVGGPRGPGTVRHTGGVARDPDELFASSSVRAHVVRGVLGAVLAVAAFGLVGTVGGWSLLLLVPAVVLWRGCPTCWALGLTQTRDRLARDAQPGECVPCGVTSRRRDARVAAEVSPRA